MKYKRIANNLLGLACMGIFASQVQAYEHGMTMITPSDQWREALPSGNGQIGALVYGSINKERILFNHNELWYGAQRSPLPDMSEELKTVRQLMSDGKYLEANQHYPSKLKEKGFSGRNGAYHPAFDMLLTTDTEFLFENYSRTLDFESGEVQVSWKDGETTIKRKLFVSIPEDLSVMSITADKANAISGDVTLDIHDMMDAIDQNGNSFNPGFTYKTIADGQFIEFHADGTDGGEFGGVLKVTVKNGELNTIPAAGKQKGTITFKAADEVLLRVAFFANEKAADAVPRLKEKLNGTKADYNELFTAHKKLHSEKFNSMAVKLNFTGKNDTPNEQLLLDAYQNPASTELMQKLFNYGRYLLISSSRSGGFPANLQGIWNGDYRAPWSSLYGNNENLQMTYWQALPGNMEEPMMAFFDYFDAHLDVFRNNAKQLYGCDGIYIPPFMSPDSGAMAHTAPHVIYWTDAAGWLASFYYDYYLFTGDEEFLKNRAIPFMKEVAMFYEDFIVKGDNGKNMFFPSQSPENQPADKIVVDKETGKETRIKVQINSTIAVAISKEVFSNLVKSCEKLNIEAEGVARWKQFIADMPDYEINEDGAMKEWLHPDFKDNYEHRHMSHIYPLFPGLEISEESQPELYKACKVAIGKRLKIGLKSQTGWSLAHMANIYGRLGEGEKALESLNILTRVCLGKNFFTYHNDWRKMGVTMDFNWGRTAPFQMDANFGITSGITEMLCSSSSDILKVLPALPAKWGQGQFRGVLTRAGVKASAEWDMSQKLVKLDFTAGRDTDFTLKLPSEIASVAGEQADKLTASDLGNHYRKLNLKEGDRVELEITLK